MKKAIILGISVLLLLALLVPASVADSTRPVVLLFETVKGDGASKELAESATRALRNYFHDTERVDVSVFDRESPVVLRAIMSKSVTSDDVASYANRAKRLEVARALGFPYTAGAEVTLTGSLVRLRLWLGKVDGGKRGTWETTGSSTSIGAGDRDLDNALQSAASVAVIEIARVALMTLPRVPQANAEATNTTTALMPEQPRPQIPSVSFDTRSTPTAPAAPVTPAAPAPATAPATPAVAVAPTAATAPVTPAPATTPTTPVVPIAPVTPAAATAPVTPVPATAPVAPAAAPTPPVTPAAVTAPAAPAAATPPAAPAAPPASGAPNYAALADDSMAAGNTALAIEQYSQAINADPKNVSVRIKLAEAYAKRGMYEQAFGELNRASAFGAEPEALAAGRKIVEDMQSAASPASAPAPAHDPNISTTPPATNPGTTPTTDTAAAIDKIMEGDKLWKAGKPDEAVDAYKESIKLNPADWRSHERLALVYVTLSMFAEGRKALIDLNAVQPYPTPEIAQNRYSMFRKAFDSRFDALLKHYDSDLADFENHKRTHESFYSSVNGLALRLEAMAQFLDAVTVPPEKQQAHLHRSLACGLMSQAASSMQSYLETNDDSAKSNAGIFVQQARKEVQTAGSLEAK